MKANREDAPTRVTHGRKQAAVWAFALVTATGITGGALYLAGANVSPQNSIEYTLTNFGNGKPAEVVGEGLAKKEIKDDAYWKRMVDEQAKRDANNQGISRLEGQGQGTQANHQRTVEQERRANEAIRILNAKNFGEGVVEQSKAQAGKTKPKEIVVVGKQETRASAFCPGGDGSIMRRNCKSAVELQSRN